MVPKAAVSPPAGCRRRDDGGRFRDPARRRQRGDAGGSDSNRDSDGHGGTANLDANGGPRATKSTATTAPGQAQPQATPAGLVQNQQAQQGGTTTGSQTATSDVAGVRGTPTVTATPQVQPDLSRQSTQCGAMQETSVALAIEQTINGVSVKATKSSTYPIEYFRCILMATGTQEAFSLAASVGKAQSAGMTHTVLIDLWITNAGKDFGQLTLKDAQLAAAGQVFSPLATLGGRADVVVSSGQGRTVTLVVAIKNSAGPTTGPVTLTIGAPLFGGQPTAGKYSLFLPTP
jgi:hypothetical protein